MLTHGRAHTHTHTHPSWKVTPGYFDCFWLLSSPPNLLSASQPHTQHFSYDFTYRLGKITPWYTMSAKSGVLSSCFGHRRLEDMSFRERVWAVLIKWYKDFIDQQVLQVMLRIENTRGVAYNIILLCLLDGLKIWLIWNASLALKES